VLVLSRSVLQLLLLQLYEAALWTVGDSDKKNENEEHLFFAKKHIFVLTKARMSTTSGKRIIIEKAKNPKISRMFAKYTYHSRFNTHDLIFLHSYYSGHT